ncbi:MAG: prephenate dehydrogenase [Cyclobacteriaceae bacterium]|nr:prephenate dehydrogenase [Cyclobacteriaceae bacterium]
MKISIVGVGLLGGSFSLGLQSVEEGHHFIGVDINEDHCTKALELGIVHEICQLDEALAKSDLVVLATPVNVIKWQLPYCLDRLPSNSVLIDLGSTKATFNGHVENHPKRSRYVSCHPIAGTENSGPAEAFPGLLKNKMMIICDKDSSDEDALNLVLQKIKKLEMRLHFMEAKQHDRHIAYVSHLSHISSFALGLTVLDKEKIEKSIFAMAGSGFSSTVRLAKSSPDMWAPIFSHNADNISEALGAYIKQLQLFKEIIDKREEDKSRELMEHANDIRRVLMGLDR